MNKLDNATIEEIQREYLSLDCPWFIGYSGGKDSSALLALVFNALKKLKKCNHKIVVIYSDTGVEIPIVRNYTKKVLKNLVKEALSFNIPIEAKIVRPEPKDSFFVKVIGRGYPTPTNKFRWCTDRLRTTPLQKFMDTITDNNKIVLLGTRKGESPERDKIILSCKTKKKKFYYQVGHTKTKIFAPIVNYKYKDVWNTLNSFDIPKFLNVRELISLYKSATDITSDSLFKSEKTGRFGCWTCTVVRKDRSVTNMSKDGYPELLPLLEFRNWLYAIRDDTIYRAQVRRNGQKGLGPFTLKARKKILDKLLKFETKSGWKLITKNEINRIYALWDLDKKNYNYREKL